MRSRYSTLLALGLFASFGCAKAKPPAATCTAASCATLINQCNVDLPDSPDYAWCIANTPLPPDGGQFPPDPETRLQICEASDQAVFVQCMADEAHTCEAPGASPARVAQCVSEQLASEGVPVSAHCDNDCQLARATCQGACALTDFASCHQCSLACSLTAIDCRKKCPREPGHCSDGTHDGLETGIDCGGDCGPCVESGTCSVAADCVSGRCVRGVCSAVLACAKVGDCTTPTCLLGTCR